MYALRQKFIIFYNVCVLKRTATVPLTSTGFNETLIAVSLALTHAQLETLLMMVSLSMCVYIVKYHISFQD